MTVRPFTLSKPGEGLHTFTGDAVVATARPTDNPLAAVAGAIFCAKPGPTRGGQSHVEAGPCFLRSH